jgi:KaiC/GvpD/RAD55 family RecA-like ATPase
MSVSLQSSTRVGLGVSVLDRAMGGGVAPGQVVALTAPAGTQSELFGRLLATRAPTRWVSTLRPAGEVRDDLEAVAPDAAANASVVHAPPDALLSDPQAALAGLPPGGHVVVDPVTPLERVDDDGLVDLLTAVKEAVVDSDGVALLHAVGGADAPGRETTLCRADETWRLDQRVEDAGVRTRFLVSKRRRGAAMTEPIRLELTDQVHVDHSRDIG